MEWIRSTRLKLKSPYQGEDYVEWRQNEDGFVAHARTSCDTADPNRALDLIFRIMGAHEKNGSARPYPVDMSNEAWAEHVREWSAKYEEKAVSA